MNAANGPAAMPISAILVTTGLSRRAGGPFFSVSGLAHALQRVGDCEPFVAGCYTDPVAWPEDASQWRGLDLAASPLAGLRSAMPLRTQILSRAKKATAEGGSAVLHASGLWDAASIATALVRQRISLPYAISPRGMLEPWALRHKAGKKRAALMLWQRSVLSGAALLHATSDLELGSIRAAGFRNPVCVIPNGIDPPETRHTQSEHGPRRCVFLSRIHPKKGLPLLLEAWARLRPAGWTLEIAGHSEDHAHEAELRRMIAEHRLDGVALIGERSGGDKWAFLGQSHLFVLPSYSENFGIVVAEAMAAGLPVIATTGTPWQVLADKQLGWCVDPSADAITAALREALAAPQATLTERGMRAREFALAEFGWPGIGRRMAACYRWMLGIGPPTPDIMFA